MAIFDNLFGNRQQRPDGPMDDGERQQAAVLLRKGLLRRLVIVLIIVAAALVWNQCVVITMPDEYVAIQQFGEIKSVTQEPGITLKVPFIQTTRSISRKLQLYDIEVSEVITQDKKTMVADSFVLWRVSDPVKYVRSLNANLTRATDTISTISYNSMKNVISGMPQSEIISGRDTLALKIFENIGNSLDEYGVELVGIETKHMDLPDDNKQAVFNRMISERNNIAASYEAEGEEEARMIRSETDRSVSIMLSGADAQAAEAIAMGEQQYMEILAQAYNDQEKAEFYAFTRALDAAKASLPQGDTTLILSSDSPIAQVFYNIQ